MKDPETISYTISKEIKEEKQIKIDTKNCFLQYRDSLGIACYFGSFSYEDDSFDRPSRIIQINIRRDSIAYDGRGAGTHGLSFSIRDIYENNKNVTKITKAVFMQKLKGLPLFKI